MSLESKNPYNKLPNTHEAVIHYQPRFLARGGDHLVYEIADHPDSVIKASTFKIKDFIAHNAEAQVPLDMFPETIEDWAGRESSPQEEIDAKNTQIQQLRKYFGKEHTLAEKRYLMKVPVTKELLEEVFRNDQFNRSLPEGAKDLDEVWSAVVVQERSDAIGNPNIDSLSLNFGSFVETRKDSLKVDAQKYKELNDELVLNRDDLAGTENAFLDIQDSPRSHSIAQVLELAKQDTQLAAVIQEFIKKSISFANETGNILALAGKDNVILFKRGDTWDYLLVDAISVHNEAMFAFRKDALHRIASGENIWEGKKDKEINYEKYLIMKTLNFVRTINGLAKSLNMHERLELISAEDKDKIDFAEILRGLNS